MNHPSSTSTLLAPTFLALCAALSLYAGCEKKTPPATATPSDTAATPATDANAAPAPAGSPGEGGEPAANDPLAEFDAASKKPEAPKISRDEQLTQGESVYDKHCAKCHGPDGLGNKKAPPVIGSNALPMNPPKGSKSRETKFQTGRDVLYYIQQKMPPKAGGSLSAEEYAAVTMFLLTANGVQSTVALWESNASELKLPEPE